MAEPRRTSTFRTLHLICEALEERNLMDAGLLAHLSPGDYRSDHLLVQFKPDAQPVTLLGGTVTEALSLVPGLYDIQIPSQITLEQALEAYTSNPSVVSAQPDFLVHAEALPNDPQISQQWAYTNSTPSATINAQAAWDKTTGSGNTIVAVIDTGIDLTHPDLVGNLWKNTLEIQGNNIDDDGNGFIDDYNGYNFINNTGNPTDDHGHGTHVAGIIGATGNNGIGVTGVNWNVKIMALKFLNASGTGSTSNALRALNYAVQMGATISNNSWTAPAYDSALEAGIRNAGLAGHIYVAAAGNLGKNLATSKLYPASYPLDNVVTVAALDSSNRLASWSNFGTTVDIAAPGVNIYSTLRGGKYGTMSGTSMATPFVTGAMALVRDANPTWTAQQVIQRVLSTADALPNLTNTINGGKLNLGAALGTSGNQPPPKPPEDTTGARVVALANLINGNRLKGLRLTFNEAINPTTFTADKVLGITGPNGSLAVTGIVPVAGSSTQFDVLFAEQSNTGNYSITLDTGILDAAGNALNQNGNNSNGEVPADRYVGSVSFAATNTYQASGLPAPVRDFSVNTYPIAVPDSMSIGAVRVTINVSHGWMSDLVIKLRSPSGAEVLLSNRRGGGGKGYINTSFDDAAGKTIQQGFGTYTGSFRPEAPLSAFKGSASNGVWTLVIEDKARGDSGTLSNWSLTFDTVAGSSSMSSTSNASRSNGADLIKELIQQQQAKAATIVHKQAVLLAHNIVLPKPVALDIVEAEVGVKKTTLQQTKAQLLTAWREQLRFADSIRQSNI